jgi:hypothetical protein
LHIQSGWIRFHVQEFLSFIVHLFISPLSEPGTVVLTVQPVLNGFMQNNTDGLLKNVSPYHPFQPDMQIPSVIPKRPPLAKRAQSMWRRRAKGRTTLTARVSHIIEARGTLGSTSANSPMVL